MRVNAEDMVEVARLVKELCGVALDDSKGYLVESRLSGLAKEAGCSDYRTLCRRAIAGDRALRTKIIDAITTQETLFFRDASPFEALKHKAIPELIDAKSGSVFPKRLRLWSAACSTGQEPYSIAMVLCELIPDVHSWDISILGTDISDAAIAQASRGLYRPHEISRGMEPGKLAKYFVQESGGWKAKDELRSLIRFQQRNLLEPFTDLGPFDVIFCRNVAIYFDVETRRDLFYRLADRLVPEGCLFVGSSESLADLGPQFAPQSHCRAIFYQPKKQASLV